MQAAEILDVVSDAGGLIWLEGDKLRARLPETLRPLVETLREHKFEIIELLAQHSVPLPTEPLYDPAEWRTAFARWMASDCIVHWRLHGSVGGLHVAFSEWEVGQDEVPCSRAVFEWLLREQGWEIHPVLALVDGLMLRKDLGMLGYFPELLLRPSR